MTFSKYHNIKTEYGGRSFMSKKEARYARTLDALKYAKDPKEKVVSYETQVPFLLQEKFIDNKGNKHQEIKYLADFVVKYKDGREEVIDIKASKGFTTDVYKLKKKMLLYKYTNINFREIY